MAKAVHDQVDHPLERTMFFSDAVFAIAITLLIIEIKVPHLSGHSAAEAWAMLANMWPSFFGYALSFLVIGRFWTAHHAALGVMKRHEPRIIWPNLILLMSVAFMPFATALMADNLTQMVAVLFYNLALFAVAMCSRWVVSIATAPENARADFSELDRVQMRARGNGVVLTTLIVCVASVFLPYGLSQILLVLMPVAQKLLFKRYSRVVGSK